MLSQPDDLPDRCGRMRYSGSLGPANKTIQVRSDLTVTSDFLFFSFLKRMGVRWLHVTLPYSERLGRR